MSEHRPRRKDFVLSTSTLRRTLGRLFALVLLLAGAHASADGLPRDGRDAQALRIAESYGESLEYCRFLAGATRNLCIVEAEGARSVALAELEAAFRPSRERARAATLAIAEAAFSTSAARCDAGPPAEQSGCMELGRAELRSARTSADLFYGTEKRAPRPARPGRDPGGKSRR